jgi:hypothetical protein
MTIYDKYNICKESDHAVFVSTITNEFYIIDYRQFMMVHSKRGSRLLADLGGITFFYNLEYVGDL